MSFGALKYLALFTMLADHVYKAFGIESAFLAIAGRISFPIFAFLCAMGFLRTGNMQRYLLRLFAAALVSELPFDLLWFGKPFDFAVQNVCFTLFFGGAACLVLREAKKLLGEDAGFFARAAALILCSAPVFLAGMARTDYGLPGAALVYFIYASKGRPGWTALILVCFNLTLWLEAGAAVPLPYFLQSFSLLALPFLVFFRDGGGAKRPAGVLARYYFYIFYPGHMLLLVLLSGLFPAA